MLPNYNLIGFQFFMLFQNVEIHQSFLETEFLLLTVFLASSVKQKKVHYQTVYCFLDLHFRNQDYCVYYTFCKCLCLPMSSLFTI